MRAENPYLRAVAVATERELGLFIKGELVEPASGENREPASRQG